MTNEIIPNSADVMLIKVRPSQRHSSVALFPSGGARDIFDEIGKGDVAKCCSPNVVRFQVFVHSGLRGFILISREYRLVGRHQTGERMPHKDELVEHV